MRTSDEVFQVAKRIKLGQDRRFEEFDLLAKYLWDYRQAKLVNGDVYEYIQMSQPMRLRLIFESLEDIQKLPILWNKRQALIRPLFRKILTDLKSTRYDQYDLNDLQIDYFRFDELVFQECVNQVETEVIRSAFPEAEIWSIHKFFTHLIVFYPTDIDVQRNEASGLSAAISDKIQEQVHAFDAFGVTHHLTVRVAFDSEENYERRGGDAYYYR